MSLIIGEQVLSVFLGNLTEVYINKQKVMLRRT